MERVLEPGEGMGDEQARAYAQADFDVADENFIRQFAAVFSDYDGTGLVLDLGCGPGNITLRFARRYPQATLHGVDGSSAMLKYARLALDSLDEAIRSRVTLIEGYVPGVTLPAERYDVILSNSLLYQLADPQALWTTVKRWGGAGTRVCVVDLFRPASQDAARQIVETYSGSEPEVLKADFYNSLCAAFTPAEVEAQLVAAGLPDFTVQTISERHLMVYGQMR